MTGDWYRPVGGYNRKGLHVGTNSVTTTDATQTDILTFRVYDGESAAVSVEVIAQDDDASSYNWNGLKAGFYHTGGTLTQIDDLYHFPTYESNSSYNVDVVADTSNNTIDVRVTGVASETVYWTAKVEILLNRGAK